jgi:hypothetical protein
MTRSGQEDLLRAIASSHTHEHTPSPIAESSPRINPRHAEANCRQGPSEGIQTPRIAGELLLGWPDEPQHCFQDQGEVEE